MKYHDILRALTSEPLFVLPSTAQSLLEMFRLHAAMSAEDFQAIREGVGSCGEKVELEQAELIDGVMHIPIAGPLGRALGKFEKGAGAVDYGDICQEIDEAEENPECMGILLDFDSPGGMVSGLQECSDRIARCEKKPIYAFSAGLIASAAYHMAAATDGIFTTKSSAIGCIGVYSAWLDISKYYEKEGVKAELFTSGKYKGMGYPGTSLTTEQRNLLAARTQDLAEQFYDHVRACRPGVEDETMQGQTFQGLRAVDVGLVDSLVRDKQHCLEEIGWA